MFGSPSEEKTAAPQTEQDYKFNDSHLVGWSCRYIKNSANGNIILPFAVFEIETKFGKFYCVYRKNSPLLATFVRLDRFRSKSANCSVIGPAKIESHYRPKSNAHDGG